jgi:hypothetical protein
MVIGMGIIFAGILAREFKFVLDFRQRPCEIQNGCLLKQNLVIVSFDTPL